MPEPNSGETAVGYQNMTISQAVKTIKRRIGHRMLLSEEELLILAVDAISHTYTYQEKMFSE